MTEFDDHSPAFDALENALEGASGMAGSFNAELASLRGVLGETTRDLGALSTGFSSGLQRAFDGVVFGGQSASDALRGLADSMSQTIYSAAIRPVTSHLGGLLEQGVNGMVSGMMPFARGGAFVQGRVMPFAKGGIVSQPTAFPMRGGTGLMGEAGPEAIMPLTRGPDGSLGVRAEGGRPVNVTLNVSTPDAASFDRSRTQIAAKLGRAIQAAGRNR